MIIVTYRQTFCIEPDNLLDANPTLDLADKEAVLNAVKAGFEDYDFNEGSGNFINLGTGIDEEDLQKALLEHKIGASHGTLLVKQEDLICDPIIWTVGDLRSLDENKEEDEDKEVDIESWQSGRCPKILRDRSIELGWDIIRDIVPLKDVEI